GLEPILEQIGHALGLRGFCGVDWILTPDAKLFVLELNGRPTALAETSRQVTEEFPAALRDFLAKKHTTRPPPPTNDDRVWHSLPNSLILAVAQKDWPFAMSLVFSPGLQTDSPGNDSGLWK